MTILGIDLGTTNSAACIWQEGKQVLIPNALGEFLTPSVVSIDESGTVLVGAAAKERLISHPDKSVSQFKRAMGTDRSYQLGKKQKFSAIQLSALLLKSLKEDAEAFLNQTITQAIISVPAYFNEHQRKATYLAAELAGFKVERLINEPTAAAIAYGLHDQTDDIKYLVLDLGGGTFDVTVLEYFDGVMEVHSTAGDNFLGGEDFTQLLMQQAAKDHDIELDQLNRQEQQQLYSAMERLKRELSQDKQVSTQLTLGKKTLEVSHDIASFSKLTSPLTKRMMEPVERALRDANLGPDDIDQVILVGGASRMPSYKQIVAKMLRKIPSATLDPDLVVALGVGIQSGLKADCDTLKEVVLTDVTPYSLGVGVFNENDRNNMYGDYFDPIIERNTVVPVSRIKQYFSVSDNQTHFSVNIYQGESRYVRNNIKIGNIDVSVPARKAGEESFTVRFSYDMSGLLDVDIEVVSTGEKLNYVIEQNANNLSDEEKAKLLKELEKLKLHPRDAMVNRNIQAQLEKHYEMATAEQRDAIAHIIQSWEAVLETQDDKKIEPFREQVKQHLDSLEQSLWQK